MGMVQPSHATRKRNSGLVPFSTWGSVDAAEPAPGLGRTAAALHRSGRSQFVSVAAAVTRPQRPSLVRTTFGRAQRVFAAEQRCVTTRPHSRMAVIARTRGK